MISTPIFAFGAPMYYTYPNYYSTVSNTIYQNDNGNAVRNFYTRDTGGYINPFMSLFGMGRQSYAVNYTTNTGGGGYSSASAKTKPRTETVHTPPKTNNANKTVHRTEIKGTQKTQATTPIKPESQTAAIQVSSEALASSIIDTAEKYSYCKEENGSHHKFCINPTCEKDDPYDQEWCTDFVTYVAKEAYQKNGLRAPSGIGHHDVDELREWAIRKGMFIRTSNKPEKASYIAKNIKPGDIFIMTENGASHTGFVTKVDKKTGDIYTIEGNRDDMVKKYKYNPNNQDLSGFIRLMP